NLLGCITPGLNFDGIPYPGVNCSCAPPDTDGYVGLTQYVQIVNTAYQVFDKATGNSVLGPVSVESVWAGFGGVCETDGEGDVVVLYDKMANRWLISQFAGTSVPDHECIAVSTTSDATGTYNRYEFDPGVPGHHRQQWWQLQVLAVQRRGAFRQRPDLYSIYRSGGFVL